MTVRIGTDLSTVRTFKPYVAAAFLTAREKSIVQRTRGVKRARLITLHWCIKEAYLKALGVGLRLHPARVEVRALSVPRGSATIYQDGTERHVSVGWVINHGYVLAVVVLKIRNKS